jgi:hypothetical protein
MWSNDKPSENPNGSSYGLGKIFKPASSTKVDSTRPYPAYEATALILKRLNVSEDFSSDGPVRYAHRTSPGLEIYFIANRSQDIINSECRFRAGNGTPELWNPLTGESRILSEHVSNGEFTTIPIRFEAHQSFFVVFNQEKQTPATLKHSAKNFPARRKIMNLEGPWKVNFDTIWGGPGEIQFNQLDDWSKRPESGIKFYSGTATYQKTFTLSDALAETSSPIFINLGEVSNLAEVSLNGVSLGTLWTTPWSLDITKSIRSGTNLLEVKVVNLWPNRLIGDEQYPSDGISNRKWPEWLSENKTRTSQRLTFASYGFYKKDTPLLKSGLLGPVYISTEDLNH